MDSFMFRVHIAEQEFAMDAPQGQNQFFERCAGMLLELSDELERNLYIEAIVKEYGRYGVGTEDCSPPVASLPNPVHLQTPVSGGPAATATVRDDMSSEINSLDSDLNLCYEKSELRPRPFSSC